MQPILQLGDVAFVRPSITTDGVENYDLARDLTLPDLFASFVGDLLGDAEPENMAEEAAPDEASVEPDSDMQEVHQQSDASSKSEHHQKSEAIPKSDDPRSTDAVLVAHEAKSSVTVLSHETEVPLDPERNNLASRARPDTQNDAWQTEPTLRGAAATPHPIQLGPGTARSAATPDIKPGRQGQESHLDQVRPFAESAAPILEVGALSSPQKPVSAIQAAVELPLADVSKRPPEPRRVEVTAQIFRADFSAPQSGFAVPSAPVSASDAVPGPQVALASSPQFMGPPLQTSVESIMSTKQEVPPASDRIGISPPSPAAQASTPLTDSATRQFLPPEPRFALRNSRAPASTEIKSALDLTTSKSEIDAPQTAKKLPTEGQALAPVLTTGPVSMGQTTKTNLELEESLRAGLTTATEHHIQSSASGAIYRNTPVQPDELPRLIARQLADISQRMPDRPVEVALNPEELGRVRMSISAHESGITMALLVERPETLDLMRRHIDQLTQEFHALGFEDVRFLFSQNSKSDGSGSDPMKQNPSAHTEDPAAEAAIQLSLSPSAGLDMRL